MATCIKNKIQINEYFYKQPLIWKASGQTGPICLAKRASNIQYGNKILDTHTQHQDNTCTQEQQEEMRRRKRGRRLAETTEHEKEIGSEKPS